MRVYQLDKAYSENIYFKYAGERWFHFWMPFPTVEGVQRQIDEQKKLDKKIADLKEWLAKESVSV